MNIHALLPLIATIAYIPLLVTTASSRPWQRRHTLFILFLAAAIVWSLIDYLLRSGLLLEHDLILIKAVNIAFPVMAVQFHSFVSSFYPQGRGRWLPFAYASLAASITLVILGYVPGRIEIINGRFFAVYGFEIAFLAVPLLVLVIRSVYILWKKLKTTDNPVIYNQSVSLLLGLGTISAFTLLGTLPMGTEYAVSHFGNLINAFILSYATIRHRLLDIRIVLRHGTAWLGLVIIGTVSFWFLLVILHAVFRFELDLTASFAATVVGMLVSIFVYRLRSYFFEVMSRVFQGSSYDYRQQLSEFTNTIHNIFSLKDQGGELLSLLTKAIGIRQACLLFPETGGRDFKAQFSETKDGEDKLSSLTLSENHPVVLYLEREQKTLTRENLTILPEFLGLWEQERDELRAKEIEMFMPLISRDHLIAILVLGRKQSGKYLLEDFHMLEDITGQVAASMEKEYLREQLQEREGELSVINRSSTIVASSLDIQEIYDSFIAELKKVVEVHWAAIVLAEESGLCFLALSSEMGTDWNVGEKVEMQGSGTEWVITHKETIYEPDLERESRFLPASRYLKWGLRSIVHLPLIARGEAIGSFIVASRQTHAYSQRQIKLLEQLTSQIAMPVENSRLYAQAEERARVDELTGLLNRRSLDQVIDTEISRHSRYGGIFSLAILDLDSFKLYNDTYGHVAGDKLLRQVGRIIKSAMRSSDQAFRYGGDEFAILLPQTTIDAASQMIERIRQKIADKVEGGNVKITASIGLASWPADGVGQIDIIAAADMALYAAKRSGGNRCHFASGYLLPLDVVEPNVGDEAESRTLSIIYAMAETVENRDKYSGDHSKKVTEYAMALGQALKMGSPDMERLEACALLHDIGMIGINSEILKKPVELTAEEWEQCKGHTRVGAAIVSHAPKLAPCVPGILYHHERYDGSGYPEGLKGEGIPLEARILAIADAFASMTSERPYSEALSEKDAIEEMKLGAGRQFDPQLVELFLATYRKRFSTRAKKSLRR